MNKFTLSQIKSYLQAQQFGEDAEFQLISIDSRTILPGSLFVAIKGENFDGHHYLHEAKTKGAVAAVVSQKVPSDIPLLLVADTRKAFGQLANFWRRQITVPVIAITGSNGKTTTKTMLASILSKNIEAAARSLNRSPYNKSVLVNQKNFNNDIGVPLTLLAYTPDHQYAVLEIGANHFGEIAYLTNIAKPDVTVIINIGPAHLEGFGDLRGVAKAKAEIFQGLKENGVAIFNYDEPFAPYFREIIGQHRMITFGLNAAADVRADHIQILPDGRISFELAIQDQHGSVILPTLGEHNVNNALAAAACAHVCGVDIAIIQEGLAATMPVDKRLCIRQGQQGARIIDDSYSAIPNAVSAALNVLARFPGERIFVFGGMAELGELIKSQYQMVGEQAQALGIEHLLAIGPNSYITVDAFGKNGRLFATKQELINFLQTMLHKQVTVLIKGSRGSRMEEVVSAITDE